MIFSSLSWPYDIEDNSRVGFWGKETADINFCEEDYIITPYIAEFINTLTNLTYILLACHGLKRTWNSPYSISLPYFGLLCVGVGSWAYHASLKRNAQLSDGLSMLFVTAFVLYRVLLATSSAAQQRRAGLMMGGTMLVTTVVHCYLNDSFLHGCIFAAMLVVIGLKTMARIQDLKDSKTRATLWILTRFGIGFVAVSFQLWLIDRLACQSIRDLRRKVGLPWGFLLELHGWWHILSGIGTYIFIVLVEVLTTDETDLDYFGWPISALRGLSSRKKGPRKDKDVDE